MTTSKPRLELQWLGKEAHARLEPRILLPDPHLAHIAERRVSGDDLFENLLVHGDNLLGLKALEAQFANSVRCAFIDPPYNTGSAFQQYEDGLEHSTWLSLMRDRVEIIRSLLRDDGSMWACIDDHESHYLKVMCDEIFGRSNFVANVVWQKKSSPQPNARWLSDSHDHILVYAKNKEIWRPNKLPREDRHNDIYRHSDEHDGIGEDGEHYGRGPWFPGDATASLTSGARGRQYTATGASPNLFTITTPSGRKIDPPPGTCWRFSPERFDEMVQDNRITFGSGGNNRPCVKRFLSEVQTVGITPMTVWHYTDVGENRVAKQEVKPFNPDEPFATPKPERLLERVLTLATDPGDLVLDSFAGSGTTGAVAHKMRRRWIMVELGPHCVTHIVPRMKAVIDGTDPNGVTGSTGWPGGGGYRFCRLAPSLLERDKWGNWVVSRKYNACMLAEALCKLEGFAYAPHPDIFWIHGHSTEADYIFVTDQNLTADQLQFLSDQVGDARTLLVCCRAWRIRGDKHRNLTLKKIPQAVLERCEWGRDDYSLNVRELLAVRLASSTGGAQSADGRQPVQELPLFSSAREDGTQ